MSGAEPDESRSQGASTNTGVPIMRKMAEELDRI